MVIFPSNPLSPFVLLCQSLMMSLTIFSLSQYIFVAHSFTPFSDSLTFGLWSLLSQSVFIFALSTLIDSYQDLLVCFGQRTDMHMHTH